MGGESTGSGAESQSGVGFGLSGDFCRDGVGSMRASVGRFDMADASGPPHI